jgi:hypothetical protein
MSFSDTNASSPHGRTIGCEPSLTPTGKRWIVQYRFGRRTRRESLGDARKITLEDARGIARKRHAMVKLNIDPAAERAKAQAAADAAALTLSYIAGRYLEAKQDRLRPATLRAAKWHFKLWTPLARLPVASITRAAVAARLGEIAKTNGPVAASRARDTMSAMYAWSIKEGLVENNPVTATNRTARAWLYREQLRDILDRKQINVVVDQPFLHRASLKCSPKAARLGRHRLSTTMMT